MDVRILLITLFFGALNLSEKTFPSAYNYNHHGKDLNTYAKSSPFGRASVKDFTKKKLIDFLARKYLTNNTDSFLPENTNNDSLKAKKDFIAPLLNGSSDISGKTDFDIQEGIKQLNKIKSLVQEMQDGLVEKQKSMGQRVNNKSTARYTTNIHRDFEENQTVYPTFLGLIKLVSQEKTLNIQNGFDSQVSNDLDKHVDAHITFQYDEENLNLLSEGAHISENLPDAISDGKTTEFNLSKYIPNSTLVYGNINNFLTDDIQSTEKFHEMITENKEGGTLMDSMNEISLSSLNNGNTKSEFTESSTSAEMSRILISTHPTLYKILHERVRSVAPQKSVTNNYRAKDTPELRKESTLIRTKNGDRLFSDFSSNEESTTTPNSEYGTESTMIENLFWKAEKALRTLKNIFLFLKNFFIENINPGRGYAKTFHVGNNTDILVHEDKANSSREIFGFTSSSIPRKFTNFSDY